MRHGNQGKCLCRIRFSLEQLGERSPEVWYESYRIFRSARGVVGHEFFSVPQIGESD